MHLAAGEVAARDLDLAAVDDNELTIVIEDFDDGDGPMMVGSSPGNLRAEIKVGIFAVEEGAGGGGGGLGAGEKTLTLALEPKP